MNIVADWTNKNIFFVLINNVPAGYIECVSPTDWKFFNANGEFKGWEINKRRAAKALS